MTTERFVREVAYARETLDDPQSTYNDDEFMQLRAVLDHVIRALEELAGTEPA